MTAPAVFVLTASGLKVAKKIQEHEGNAVLFAPERLVGPQASGSITGFSAPATVLREVFQQGKPIVGVMAAGILIRLLAPVLGEKQTDPPVLSVSESGKHVVPLLGGHKGGNDLARRIAKLLDGIAAVTTAGESELHQLLETPPAGWSASAPTRYPRFARHLLEGGNLRLNIADNCPGDAFLSALPAAQHFRLQDSEAPLSVSLGIAAPSDQADDYPIHPHLLAVGLGAERGVEAKEVIDLIESCLQHHGLSPAAIAGFFSLDLKADEAAFRTAAAHFERPFRLFSKARLAEEESRLKNPSTIVADAVGIAGVAEAAALAAAGPAGFLRVEKTKSPRATLAIAEAPHPIAADQVGRGLGRLSIVGLGPGDPAWRSAAARAALDAAEDFIGFHGYLALLRNDGYTATQHGFNLGEETDRARHALDLAAEGRRVALISSGDPGIYAMAAVIFQLLAEAPAPAWRYVAIEVVPSVSAFQLAGAVTGAPFGHDFALISLSDLLTPWSVIEERLQAAGAGDFVLGLYNPASQRRRAQLSKALAILRRHRPPETPVLMAKSLGREGQTLSYTTLATLPEDKVDMMTLLVIGSTQTRQFEALGRSWLYTPRGYDAATPPSQKVTET